MDNIDSQMSKIFDDYVNTVNEVTDKTYKDVSKEAVQKLKNTSPKRPGGGEYANSWASKKNGNGYVVYNREHYRLTHLLEKSHVVRNKYGTYGRSTPQVHIKPVEEWAINEALQKIEIGLSKG